MTYTEEPLVEQPAIMLERTSKPKRSDIERLKNIIERRLGEMIKLNISRQDLQGQFQQLIEQYNLVAYQAEQFFAELRNLVLKLNAENKRGAREGLSEEELAIFDLLCKEVELSEQERNNVKSIAKELLNKLKTVLVLDWRKKQRTKARVHNAIEEILDQLPNSYTDDIWPKACEHVYIHVFDKYVGEGKSVYY